MLISFTFASPCLISFFIILNCFNFSLRQPPKYKRVSGIKKLHLTTKSLTIFLSHFYFLLPHTISLESNPNVNREEGEGCKNTIKLIECQGLGKNLRSIALCLILSKFSTFVIEFIITFVSIATCFFAFYLNSFRLLWSGMQRKCDLKFSYGFIYEKFF